MNAVILKIFDADVVSKYHSDEPDRKRLLRMDSRMRATSAIRRAGKFEPGCNSGIGFHRLDLLRHLHICADLLMHPLTHALSES